MSRIKPYSGLSLDRLVADLLKENNLHLEYGTDFTLSAPHAFPTDETGRNTSVVFTPLVWDSAFNAQQLSYTRLPINVLAKLPEGYILPVPIETFPVTTKQLLGSINESLGLDLISDEIVDHTYNIDDLEFTITINEEVSHAWIGSYGFEIYVHGRHHLRVAIVNKMLDEDIPFPPSYVAPQEYSIQTELLKLINQVNPTTSDLISTDVAFGNTTPISDPSIPANTKVRVLATDSSHYYGSVEVYYNRYALSELGDGFALLTEQPITADKVVEYLNTEYNAHLKVDDIEDCSLSNLTIGDTGTLSVKTSVKSLAWNGELEIPYLFGLPTNIDKLHILVNHTLPSPGYLT